LQIFRTQTKEERSHFSISKQTHKVSIKFHKANASLLDTLPTAGERFVTRLPMETDSKKGSSSQQCIQRAQPELLVAENSFQSIPLFFLQFKILHRNGNAVNEHFYRYDVRRHE
jgi:hypothetical protein